MAVKISEAQRSANEYAPHECCKRASPARRWHWQSTWCGKPCTHGNGCLMNKALTDCAPCPTAGGRANSMRPPSNGWITHCAQGAYQEKAADRLGRPPGARQSAGAQLSGLHQRGGADSFLAAVSAGLQSGGVSVGMAQAPCAGQLLPSHFARTQDHRQMQAQKCPTSTLHHHGLLETGRALVVS